MTILEQLRKAISEYKGPLPATGNSIEEMWLRQAFKSLIELERQTQGDLNGRTNRDRDFRGDERGRRLDRHQ